MPEVGPPKNEKEAKIEEEFVKAVKSGDVKPEKEKDEKPHPSESDTPVSKLLEENVHYSKNKDDLLDVHVGNPLRKITLLLEEIKKQKAFSFTLKGSLGIAGVALALGVFGVFGGGKMLCDKGVQSEIGVVKTLNIIDYERSTIPVISIFLNYFNQPTEHQRLVLIKPDETVVRLAYSKGIDFKQYENFNVIATGGYDSCSKTLTITDPAGIETYSK